MPIVNVLPADAELLRCGSITWPASQFKMSLAGFKDVFAQVVEVHLPKGMTIQRRRSSRPF
jgi:predicted nucleotidyltransferase